MKRRVGRDPNPSYDGRRDAAEALGTFTLAAVGPGRRDGRILDPRVRAWRSTESMSSASSRSSNNFAELQEVIAEYEQLRAHLRWG